MGRKFEVHIDVEGLFSCTKQEISKEQYRLIQGTSSTAMVYPSDSLTRFRNQIQSSSSNSHQGSSIFVPKRLRSSSPPPEAQSNLANRHPVTNHATNSPHTLLEEDENTNTMIWDGDEEESNETAPTNCRTDQISSEPVRQISTQELCTYEILDLLDSFGAPRYSYDKLVALLRRQKREHDFDVTDAICRDTFLRSLKKNYSCPTIETRMVQNRKIFLFPFVQMLEDLVNEIEVQLHTIEPSSTNIDIIGTDDELWNTPWMHQTFECHHHNFSSNHDIMLPIIIYMDKTGTDAYQRYSLEPIIFSTAAIPRENRDKRQAWRHIGFIPSSKDLVKAVDKMQFHHDCLTVLLEGLQAAQHDPPLIKVKDRVTGSILQKRARVPLMLIMGDQLSQDILCSRLKANSGGAGRVHRSCMCSYMTVDDASHKCQGVPQDLLSQMTSFASLSDAQIAILANGNQREIAYLKRFRKMNHKFLEHPFGCHPIKNAFDSLDFGAWPTGIHDACVDDFMHSCELGVIKSLCNVLFDGLQNQESHKLEHLISSKFNHTKSSVRNTYPRWRLNEGFSRQTLMTSTERVGSLFSLCLALQHEDVKKLISKAHKRQMLKYETFPHKAGTEKSMETDLPSGGDEEDSDGTSMSEASYSGSKELQTTELCNFFFEKHCMCDFTEEQICHLLTHMCRHGFDVDIIHSLDVFQIRILMSEANSLFKKDDFIYPRRDMGIYFQDLGEDFTLDPTILKVVVKACSLVPDEILGQHRFHGVDNVKIKHMKSKSKTNGDKTGSTAAILTDDMNAVAMFFEYVLCFHSFCKYSSTLPPSLRDNFDLVEVGGRTLVCYFERMFYRGDNSIDSRTTKVHVHLRVGMNYRNQRNLMHSSCETGERLLKTEAKGISKTAQQRGEETFEKQTCQRIQDRHLMGLFSMEVEKQYPKEENSNKTEHERFSRKEPHFILHRAGERCYSVDAKGKKQQTSTELGEISPVTRKALLKTEPDMNEFHIYLEAVLRDGSFIRAFPMYRQEQPWYDFVNIIWEGGQVYPARCVCFYKKYDESEIESLYALVHVTDETTFGRVSGFTNSLLTSHYKMKYHRNQPVFYAVKLEAIDSAVLCYPHVPTNSLYDPYNSGMMIIRPRNEWAYVWLAWTEVLKEENSESKFHRRKRRQNRRYVSLCDPKVVKKVHARVNLFLSELHV